MGFIPSGTGPVITKVEDVTTVLMYRVDQFQVQMICVPPNYIIPEHVHPNIDSYEVGIGGGMCFSRNGHWITNETIDFHGRKIEWHGAGTLNKKRGSAIRVKPNDIHGGMFGPEGGVFLSVQQWLNGVLPSCVGADYAGKVLGPSHADHVKEDFNVIVKKQSELTWRDAAYRASGPANIIC
jgi:hypothetical protein